MEILSNFWIWLLAFLTSLGYIVYSRKKAKENVQAQFVITTGCLMIVFYTICIISGICTILNFLWRWVL